MLNLRPLCHQHLSCRQLLHPWKSAGRCSPLWVLAEAFPSRRGVSREGKSALLLGGIYIVKSEDKKKRQKPQSKCSACRNSNENHQGLSPGWCGICGVTVPRFRNTGVQATTLLFRCKSKSSTENCLPHLFLILSFFTHLLHPLPEDQIDPGVCHQRVSGFFLPHAQLSPCGKVTHHGHRRLFQLPCTLPMLAPHTQVHPPPLQKEQPKAFLTLETSPLKSNFLAEDQIALTH